MLVRSLGMAYCRVVLFWRFIVDCGFWWFDCLILLLVLGACWWVSVVYCGFWGVVVGVWFGGLLAGIAGVGSCW